MVEAPPPVLLLRESNTTHIFTRSIITLSQNFQNCNCDPKRIVYHPLPCLPPTLTRQFIQCYIQFSISIHSSGAFQRLQFLNAARNPMIFCSQLVDTFLHLESTLKFGISTRRPRRLLDHIMRGASVDFILFIARRKYIRRSA